MAIATPPASLSVSDFTTVLTGLEHPEGIAATPDGRLFLSEGGSAIAVVERDGSLRRIGKPLMPNGVAIDRQGRAIVANMGLINNGPGPLQRIDVETGAIETLVDSLEGRQLVASNGPAVARDGTIYCTHSKWDGIANIGATAATGFIYRVTPDGTASIVARDLRGANGLCLDREERFLYASLTAEGRIRRWRRLPDGSLGEAEDYGPQLGTVIPDHRIGDIIKMPADERAQLGYCDGIAFDMAGNLWITLPFANKLIALTPRGQKIDIAHDPEGKAISMPTNLCWGGTDRRDLYVVSRRSGIVVKTRTAIAGVPLANWPAV
jgi:gluconolactonase